LLSAALFQRLIRYFKNTAMPIARATPIRTAIASLSSTPEIVAIMRAVANHFSDTRRWRLAKPATKEKVAQLGVAVVVASGPSVNDSPFGQKITAGCASNRGASRTSHLNRTVKCRSGLGEPA
jgi:hypothetical protein